MKKLLLIYLALLVSTSSFSQVTVTLSNMTNGGNTVSSGSPIAIPSGGGALLNFTVKLSKSSSLVVNGNLYVYTKKSSSDFPVTRYGPLYVTNGMFFGSNPVEYTSSQNFSISAADFNASGGTLYAEYMTDGSIPYRSSNWAITVSAPPIPPISNNGITASQSIVSGTAAAPLTGSTPTGGNGTYTYTWQKSTGTWTTISGATSINYSPGVLTTTTSYRRIVASTGVSTSTSNTVTITVVSPPITNNTISGTQTIDEGSSPAPLTGSTPGGGNGSYTYQWQRKEFHSSTWSNITGATSVNYSPSIMTGTASFRRIVNSGTAGANTSNEIAVTVINYPLITNNSIAFDGVSTIIGTVPLGGNDSYTYEYFFGVDNGIGGIEFPFDPTTNKDIVIPEYLLDLSELYPTTVTRTVRSVNKTSVSRAIILEIGISDISNNTLTFDGLSYVTGSTPSGGPGTGYTYSWEYLDADNISVGAPPMTLSGATGKDLTVPVGLVIVELDMHVRRIVTSGSKISYSEWISVYVPASNIPNVDNNTIVFDGTSIVTGSTPTGGLGGYTYRWELFESATSMPSALSGYTGKDLSVPIGLTTATELDPYVRRVVTSAMGLKTSYSDWVSVLATGSGARQASSTSNPDSVLQESNTEESLVVINLYPNPAIGKVNFQIGKPGKVEVVIYTESKRALTVFKGYADRNTVVEWIIPNDFSKGMYFYKVIGENGILKTGKIIYQ